MLAIVVWLLATLLGVTNGSGIGDWDLIVSTSLLLLLNEFVLVGVSVAATLLSALVLLLVLESVGGVVSSATTTIGAAVEVDQRPALAGVQFAWTSPAFPQAPISYLRLVAVVA